MIPVVLALYCLVAPLIFLGVIACAGFVGARLSTGEFSWWRYWAWLAGAFVGAILMLAAKTMLVFLIVAVVLVTWVLLRAAADAQSITLRERIGFMQLYAGLCLVEYGAMRRTGMLDGVHASTPFSFVLHDYLGQLTLPVTAAVSVSRPGAAWAVPGDVVGHVAQALSASWLLTVALATFATAALIYAYFAEHATPEVGLALLPARTLVSIVFAALWGVVLVSPANSVVGYAAALAGIFLAPFFVAEGVWVLHRRAVRLRTRTLWATLVAAFAVVVPSLAAVLAVLGLVFHLVRLRSFEPILGDVQRSAARPRLKTAALLAVATSATFAVLGAAEGAVIRHASPRITTEPGLCNRVTLTAVPNGITIAGPNGAFTIDADEAKLEGKTFEAARAACAARGARPCTSDEWYVACLCTYPNESIGGSKLSVNERLVYRLESDRSAAGTEDVKGLLTGASELVAPTIAGGGVLLAGPNDAIPDHFTADCRYRSLLPETALTSELGSLTGVRCCR